MENKWISRGCLVGCMLCFLVTLFALWEVRRANKTEGQLQALEQQIFGSDDTDWHSWQRKLDALEKELQDEDAQGIVNANAISALRQHHCALVDAHNKLYKRVGEFDTRPFFKLYVAPEQPPAPKTKDQVEDELGVQLPE